MKAQRLLAIAAGPLYVDFGTREVFPPTGQYHTQIEPRGETWKREIGGSAWKFSREWLSQSSDGDLLLLVSRLATGKTADAFADSARWLAAALKREEESLRADRLDKPFELATKEAESGVDLTFHLRHPRLQPWPVFTIGGGAAKELQWRDVLEAWRNRAGKGHGYSACCVFLSGILRTSLLETLYEALEPQKFLEHEEESLKDSLASLELEAGKSKGAAKRGRAEQRRKEEAAKETQELLRKLGEAKAALRKLRNGEDKERESLRDDTRELLEKSHLALEFGRADLRQRSRQGGWLHYKKVVQTCVRSARTVFVDATTAQAFDLILPENMPKDYLVFRPRGVLPGQWKLFRRSLAATAGKREFATLQSLTFTAPSPKTGGPEGSTTDPTRRPARTSVLLGQMIRGEFPEPRMQGDWRRYVRQDSPASLDEITQSPTLRRSLERLEKLLRQDLLASVMMYGETGTGKEVIARWIRRIHPTRSEYPLVAVSCGRLDSNIVESDLFGHVEGAFTGATRPRTGHLVDSSGGILLLDDLDALDLSTQARLLRVIEDGVVCPLGGGEADTQVVDVFFIVTTNVHPKQLLGAGKLREDLYFRLLGRGMHLELPPLRDPERRPDALRAADELWRRNNTEAGCELELPRALEDAINTSPLKGNFRTVEAAVNELHRQLLVGQGGSGRLPGEVEDLLQAPVAERPQGKEGHATTEPAASALLERLKQTPRFAALLGKTTDEEKLKDLLSFWCDAKGEGGPGIERSLKTTQIAACLGLERSEARRLYKLLKAARSWESFPKLRLEGKGRGQKWGLLCGEESGTAPGDAAGGALNRRA